MKALALLSMLALVGCGAASRDVVSVQRFGDPHGGLVINGFLCAGSSEGGWRCLRYAARRDLALDDPRLLDSPAANPLPASEVQSLRDAIGHEEVSALADSLTGDLHGLVTRLLVRSGGTTRQVTFVAGPTLTGAPAPRDRIIAALWQAVTASKASVWELPSE
jgi:hypothetical protein